MRAKTLAKIIQRNLIDSGILIHAQVDIITPDTSSLLFLHKHKVVLISHKWLVQSELQPYDTNLRIAISRQKDGFRVTSSGHGISSSFYVDNLLKLSTSIGAIWQSNRVLMIRDLGFKPKMYITI